MTNTAGMVHGTVALASCRRSGEAGPDELYPDANAGPLGAALSQLGIEARALSWDDPNVDWAAFSHVFISSTWDSVDRPVEYLDWVRLVSEVSLLVNPMAVVEWNLDKLYQRELEAAGVPVIPTSWLAPGAGWSTPPGDEFVVKPSVSAGGRNTARYARGDRRGVEHARALQQAGQTVMVQEYMSSIDEEGEVDLVFIDGSFSHAVRKLATLHVGGGMGERPWERVAWTGLVTPHPRQLMVAEDVIGIVSKRLGQGPIYSRVDLVSSHAGDPLVLEVELIDPYLSLDLVPVAAARLATALMGAPT